MTGEDVSVRAADVLVGANGAAAGSSAGLFGDLVDSVRSVLFTDLATARLAVGCLVSQGHLLVEDLPGVGKTTLAKALARSFGLDFRRVQCTADLLPADVIGALVFDRERAEPTFRPGPVFTNVLMADELNRASTRAQSALLEAMEERHVSVDGQTYPLPDPFMVVATQNPYDAAGTSPLPHGQRDRFLLCLSLGYPDGADEDALLTLSNQADRVATLPPAVSAAELRELMAAVSSVYVSTAARRYVLGLVHASRRHAAVAVGASPRAAMAVVRAASALAVAAGRTYISADDIRAVAGPVLGHRLLLDAASEATGVSALDIVAELLELVPAPLGDEADAEPVR